MGYATSILRETNLKHIYARNKLFYTAKFWLRLLRTDIVAAVNCIPLFYGMLQLSRYYVMKTFDFVSAFCDKIF